jgi:hypothetical protein
MSTNRDYAGQVAKLGWYRKETRAHCCVVHEGPFTEKELQLLSERCHAQVMRREPVRYNSGDAPIPHPDYRGVVPPFIVTPEEVFPLRLTQKQIDYGRKPITREEANNRVSKLMWLLWQNKPSYFYHRKMQEWHRDAMAKLVDDTSSDSMDFFVHAELWEKRRTSEQMWVLAAMLKGWPPPEATVEKAVWSRLTGRGAVAEEFEF